MNGPSAPSHINGAVIVATDDRRIFAAVEGFGGRAVMTCSDHASGTDRLAEVAEETQMPISWSMFRVMSRSSNLA